MNAMEIAVNLIALHGGELVGRTRFQKRAYLLHRCGASFTLKFVCHHYGPYRFSASTSAEHGIEIVSPPSDPAGRSTPVGRLPVSSSRPQTVLLAAHPRTHQRGFSPVRGRGPPVSLSVGAHLVEPTPYEGNGLANMRCSGQRAVLVVA